jgi:hypothetical protein
MDFGLPLEDTRRALREVAAATPMGDAWLTRFVDAVLGHYRASP